MLEGLPRQAQGVSFEHRGAWLTTRSARGIGLLAVARPTASPRSFRRSDRANVLRARSLGAHALVVGNLLPLAELLETNALDGGHVKEHVLSRVVRDETKTL